VSGVRAGAASVWSTAITLRQHGRVRAAKLSLRQRLRVAAYVSLTVKWRDEGLKRLLQHRYVCSTQCSLPALVDAI
jgi:hypothetical protein